MSKIQYLAHEIMWSDTPSRLNSFRKQGPCLIHNNGDVTFSQIHLKAYNRRNGPARIYSTGYIAFTNTDGYPHRTDGPAIIFTDGRKIYCVDCEQLSPEEFFIKYGVM